MSVVETVLIFVGFPALIIAILAVLTIGRGAKTPGRFKLGETWTGQPMWFVGHPRPHGTHEAPEADTSTDTVKGGASGSW